MWFEEEKSKLYVKPYPQSLKVFSFRKMHYFSQGQTEAFLVLQI